MARSVSGTCPSWAGLPTWPVAQSFCGKYLDVLDKAGAQLVSFILQFFAGIGRHGPQISQPNTQTLIVNQD